MKGEQKMKVTTIITEMERYALIQKAKELLGRYEWEFTDRAVSKIIDTWAVNKANLITAFKKHPNYIGNFMIAYDVEYEREIDPREIHNFSRWLDNIISETEFPEEITAEMEREKAEGNYSWYYSDIWHEGIERKLSYHQRDFIQGLGYYLHRTASKAFADDANKLFPNAHIHEGMKMSKAINKLCTYLGFSKHTDYNRKFAKCADALSPLKITRHTVLSVNPLDYLTMSFGNSWSSCHTIDKLNIRDSVDTYEGQYCSGTLSYMLDSSSMVLYTVSADYNGNEYYTQEKITRQMFHYEDGLLVQGRLYPSKNDGYKDHYDQPRQLVQSVMAEIYDLPNYWTVKRNNIYNYIDSDGTHYRDYNHFADCTLSVHKEIDPEGKYVHIGHDPICIECGDEHGEERQINCCTYLGEECWTCEDCGCSIYDEDDVYYIDGGHYCEDCVEYCESCEEYHRSETYYIEGYGNVCEYCFNEYAQACDNCGDYHWRDDMHYVESEEEDVCSYCYREYYRPCDICGTVMHQSNLTEVDGVEYCADCISEIEIEEVI